MKELSKPVARLPVDVSKAMVAIAKAKKPEQLRPLESELERAENIMRESGLYTKEQMRSINETRMWAFWKLGKLLRSIERGKAGRPAKNKERGVSNFKSFIAALDPPLVLPRAIERQRVGEMPKNELERVLVSAHKNGDLVTISAVLQAARPWWYKASREKKHKTIQASAIVHAREDLGPFPLIYADPPWKFEVYSAKGLDRTPDQHYPTLTDEDIIRFEIDGKTIPEIAHDDATLLLWCTSSNIERALRVMREWDFTYKSQAVWVKMKDGKLQTGMGLVFRNAHEVLLYGTRGNMPGPQYQPPSVLIYPRGRHSAKPPEVRRHIEKMYPDFTAKTRLELFAREKISGWTCRGFEANDPAA